VTYVVGHAADERGTAALHLAAMLARSSGDDLVVCAVVPRPWFPSMARIDAEYHAYLDTQADESLALAKAQLPADVSATFVRVRAKSAPVGLLDVAQQRDANLIVLGSSTAGVFGHVALGSVTDRLLHSSHLPVALATRGFRARPGVKVRRVTAAYGGSENADDLAVSAASVAARVGAALRLASFAVWARPAYTTRLGSDGEDAVLAEWLTEMRSATEEALVTVRSLPNVPPSLEAIVGMGTTWPEAIEDIEWDDGDVLVVGSSSVGPVERVFLGSRAAKIVRHSPVPVVVVPRSAAEELADQAGQT
jgi:nucleotide-binding universal stress UspA family protein